MKPWGPLDWLISKLPVNRSHPLRLLACISAEERCKAVPELVNSLGASEICLLTIKDPPSRYTPMIEAKIQRHLREMEESGIKKFRPETLDLFAADQQIGDLLTGFLSSKGTFWIDISCMPKRFFFLLVKLALRHQYIDTLLVTYTQPSPGLYTEEHLAEDPSDVQPLPGFGPIGDDADTLIVAIGFESLGLPQFLGDYRDKKRDIFVIVPFPPGQPYSRRIWESVLNTGQSGHNGNMKRVPAIDAFGTYSLLASLKDPRNTSTRQRPPALAPYGPKPVSLGMCLYAIECNSAVLYTQPRIYHPDYTLGVGQSWGYCLKLNGRKVWGE